MRILIALIVVVSAAWSAYWVVGSRMLRSAIDEGIARMEARGVSVETDDIRVTGFPNRFDTMIDAPRVAWPGGAGWSAPFLQVFALSYAPNRVIVAFPETQTLDTAAGAVEVGAGRARASATFSPEAGGMLDHANLVWEEATARWAGREAAAGRVLAATRVADGMEADVQNIGVTLDDVALPRDLLPGAGAEARLVDGVTLDALVHLDAAPTRLALETGEIAVERIEIDRLDLDWGGAALDAEGTLDVGPEGLLTGRLDVTLTGWDRALEIAEAAGLLAEGRLEMARQGLGALSAGTERADRVRVPLELRDGRVWLGPVPLGPAPRL